MPTGKKPSSKSDKDAASILEAAVPGRAKAKKPKFSRLANLEEDEERCTRKSKERIKRAGSKRAQSDEAEANPDIALRFARGVFTASACVFSGAACVGRDRTRRPICDLMVAHAQFRSLVGQIALPQW